MTPILKKVYQVISPRKHNLLKRDFKKYDKAELVAEVININRPGILSPELGDPNHS